MQVHFSLDPDSNKKCRQIPIVSHLIAVQILPGIQEAKDKDNQSNNTLGIPPLKGLGWSWSSRYNSSICWTNCGCSYLGNDVQQTWVTVSFWKGFQGRLKRDEFCQHLAKMTGKLAIFKFPLTAVLFDSPEAGMAWNILPSCELGKGIINNKKKSECPDTVFFPFTNTPV